VAIYARVSSAENKGTLDRQAERLAAYWAARGYQVAKVVKEIGSGINDARPKLLARLADQSIGLMVVEHKDRLTRFGFRYVDTLLKNQGRALEVVNQAENGENGTEGLLSDLTAIVYSFCARRYGPRRAKRKTEALVRALEATGRARGKPMHLVERHVIRRADPRFAAIDGASFAAKNRYNAANYVVRQSFIHEGVSLTYHEMHRRMKDHAAYQALPAKVAQWVLRLLDTNWASFFAARPCTRTHRSS
jgi:predicted site-specific integrase-resolvase